MQERAAPVVYSLVNPLYNEAAVPPRRLDWLTAALEAPAEVILVDDGVLLDAHWASATVLASLLAGINLPTTGVLGRAVGFAEAGGRAAYASSPRLAA